MPYIAKKSPNSLHGSTNYFNSKGNHECAILVQGVSDAPQTSMWRKGKKVIDSLPNEISPGTVIATFDDTGTYPAIGNHAAIYISHDKDGIHVIDQWKAQGKALIRIIRSKKSAHRDVNDSNWYYVVE